MALNRDDEALSVTGSFGDVKEAPLALAHIAALVGTGATDEALEAMRRQVTEAEEPTVILSYVELLFMLDATEDAFPHLRRALMRGPEAIVANVSSIIDAVAPAVANGHAPRVLQLLDEFELQDVLRPVYEALRIVVSGEREALKRLAPEVQQATAELLDRWQPQAVIEKKPRKKAAPRGRRRRLT